MSIDLNQYMEKIKKDNFCREIRKEIIEAFEEVKDAVEEVKDAVESNIEYISPTSYDEFIELTKNGGIFYSLTTVPITCQDSQYDLVGLCDVRPHSNGINYYAFNKMWQILVDSTTNTVTHFSSFSSFIQSKIPTDIELDENNLLYLIRDGVKIGTGITLPTIAGENVEFQKSTDYIQWRYVGDTDWNNLVALTELKGNDGAKGDKGDTGATGQGVVSGGTTGQILAKKSNTDYDTEWINAPSGGNSDIIVTTEIADGVLTLTTDKYQTTTIADGTEITLPTVTDFTEIHLFFSSESDLTLILPNCGWQNDVIPTISSHHVYEFIFTYFNESWIGGVIEYGSEAVV